MPALSRFLRAAILAAGMMASTAQRLVADDMPQIGAPAAEARPAAKPASHSVKLPFVDLAESLIAESLPRDYVDEKAWGLQKHFSTGLKVEREGFKIETRRRKELINHGTWKRYFVAMRGDEKLKLDIGEVTPRDDGRVSFRVTAAGPVRGRAELQQWERGVRLVGISADCEATIRLTLDIEASLRSEQGVLLPNVSVSPKVVSAQAELIDFRLRRIGDLRGPLAKELGDAAEPTLRREVARQNEKIAAKINKAIAKRADDLKVSGDDFLKDQWSHVKEMLRKAGR